jgi:hypothetical protein
MPIQRRGGRPTDRWTGDRTVSHVGRRLTAIQPRRIALSTGQQDNDLVRSTIAGGDRDRRRICDHQVIFGDQDFEHASPTSGSFRPTVDHEKRQREPRKLLILASPDRSNPKLDGTP